MERILPSIRVMMVRLSTFFVLSILYAADPQQLQLTSKAQADFDRVQLAASPVLADTTNCVQSQAAALPVSTPEDAAQLYYRRGYCTLAGAMITGDNREYLAAAADFDRAIEAWPARSRKALKKQAPEPVPGALRLLPVLARLHASSDDAARKAASHDITAALDASSCTSNLMPGFQCEQFRQTGREWLGWIALGENRLDDAARYFAGGRNTGWPEWVEGQRLFQQGRYSEAAAREELAISLWKSGVSRRLGPAPDVPVALAELGGAQLLMGNAKAAIQTLNASLKAQPSNSHALFHRAMAHEMLGETEAAYADYSMASRTAFASATDLASGEAHLYRGILLYRRKNYERAEDEFSSALNFEIPQTLRADAQAWRHMAAVASGSCESAREFLDRTLPGVSPYFPREEARRLATACTTETKPEYR